LSRFSQLYIERGEPSSDSARLRNRLAAAFVYVINRSDALDVHHEIIGRIELQLGIRVPLQGPYPSIPRFFRDAETRDVLDAVTIIHECFHGGKLLRFWIDHVTKAFEEENVGYRLGGDGIVHPFVDSEFEANRAAALEGLTGESFGEAKQDFEAAFRHLRNGEGKQAIRMMFPAVEVAAKVLYPGAISRLMPNEIEKNVAPTLERKYAGNQPAISAGKLMLGAFKDWIAAAQLYRHGQEVSEPADPPQDFVVAFVSAGATFLRWLIELQSQE